jgi:steroid delta-isomerase-like uncharacterized protein
MADGKALVRRWIELAWNRGDVSLLDQLHAPGFRDRTGNPGATPDTAGLKQVIRSVRAAFPDAVFTIDDLVAEDNRVAARWTMRGTHMGEFNGIAATGRPLTLPGFGLLRIDDGRIAELWHLEDDLAALRQLGALSGPG